MKHIALIYSAVSSWRVNACAVISLPATLPLATPPLGVCARARVAELPLLDFGMVSGALSFQHHGSYAARSTCKEGEDGCQPAIIPESMQFYSLSTVKTRKFDQSAVESK